MAIETTITTVAIEMIEEAIKEENATPVASATSSVVVIINNKGGYRCPFLFAIN